LSSLEFDKTAEPPQIQPAMPIIDTHLHLTDKRFDEDRPAVLRRAAEAGVVGMVTIGITLDNARAALELVRETNAAAEITVGGPGGHQPTDYQPDAITEVPVAPEDANEDLTDGGTKTPQLWATAGFHPHHAKEFDAAMADDLKELWAQPEVVVVGEIGLDYHYDHSPRDVQARVFRQHIDWAVELDLPIVIHCRESFDDIYAILQDYRETNLRGVFHCFSEGPAQAEKVLALGFMLGFGGVVTFPKSDNVREAATLAGPTKCLVETDAPYLSPVPKRGRRNESSYLPHVISTLATCWNLSIPEVETHTTHNAHQLYNII
jgi:TatD DNase family protein